MMTALYLNSSFDSVEFCLQIAPGRPSRSVRAGCNNHNKKSLMSQMRDMRLYVG